MLKMTLHHSWSQRSKGDDYQRYNLKLKDGVDVVLGGGKRQFLPKDAGGKRTDGRNLITEMQKAGYRVVFDENQLSQVQLAKNEKLLGLFNHSHLNYRLGSHQEKLGRAESKANDAVCFRHPDAK